MILEKILPTTEYVSKNSHWVRIDQTAVEKMAKSMKNAPIPGWANPFHFQGDMEKSCQYVFLLDALNFCFWAKKGEKRWTIKDKGKEINGYFALALALKKAIKKYPLLNADYLSEISHKDLADILAPCNGQAIPLFEKRLAIVRQTGAVLAKKYKGQALNVIREAKQSGAKMVELVFRDLPSFRDTAVFHGKKIYLLKRAQILTADVWGALGGKGLGRFKDIERLTCFADYKIPQILHHFGVLEYSPELLRKIKSEKLIAAGSSEEIEIRANTVQAVERIRQALERQGRKIPAFQADWILWNMSQKIKMLFPYHKTRTIYY
ncbi:MAG: queuosine salvage family protein [Candidatus Pacebacteria bacterium]|nr:queuosine salvage family protein [Candidatus Paceibacterota bacterium]